MGGFVVGYHADPSPVLERWSVPAAEPAPRSDAPSVRSPLLARLGKMFNDLNAGPNPAAMERLRGTEPLHGAVEEISYSRSSADAAVTLAPGLSEGQKKELVRLFELAGTQATPVRRPRPARVVPDPAVWDAEEPVTARVETQAPLVDTCKLGFDHDFIRPISLPTEGAELRLCPERALFLSKNRTGAGWVKVEGGGHLKTLTHQPAPNGGATLLLDEPSLSALALRSGIGLAQGAGVLVGPVPPGTRVGFVGRSEDPQVFESGGRKYFIILNAEPGAGVLEVALEHEPGSVATVFAPVLGDVITYVDLARPQVTDLRVRVVKSGRAKDPEAEGLTVGWSMHQGIQAITRSEGVAEIRGVQVVPGFPAYLDVQSRRKDEPGFVYRYEIKNPLAEPGAERTHLLPQIPERQLSRWLQQVKQGLSDQSAMVVGRLRPVQARGPGLHAVVDPLTSRYGLEPITFSLLWDGSISRTQPLDSASPRFMSVQVAEGLSQVRIGSDSAPAVHLGLLPVSPRVIHVVSE